MRTLLRTVVVLALLTWTVPVSASAETSPKVDGAVWLESSQAEKLAFLLGVEMTIAAEQAIEKEQRAAGQNEKASPFVTGWVTALGDVPRHEVVRRVNAYLADNPNARTRHIFDIIWYEMIAPKLGAPRR